MLSASPAARDRLILPPYPGSRGQAAIHAIRSHPQRGGLAGGLIFDTAHANLQATFDEDLPALELAVRAAARSLGKGIRARRPA